MSVYVVIGVIIGLMGHVYADCPSGQELDAETQTCRQCAVGFYRNAGSDDNCKKCPKGVITRHLGATSWSDCDMSIGSKAQCPSGTEWVSRLEKCVVCNVDTYRRQGTDYWCVDCPSGTHTLTDGATGPEDCKDPCTAGSEWDTVTIDCSPCLMNTFKEAGSGTNCQPCPADHVTRRTGAARREDCIALPANPSLIFSAADCPPGTQWNNVSKSCDSCLINQYSRGDPESICQPCGPGLVTLHPGATAQEMCMDSVAAEDVKLKPYTDILCPLGTERSRGDEGCKPCPRGYIKDKLSQLVCRKCPDQLTTSVEGATSGHFCGLGGVPPGLIPFRSSECPVGTEWISDLSSCRTCRMGFYRNDLSQPQCLQCMSGRTTYHTGSISSRDCSIPGTDIDGQPFAYHTPGNCPSGSEWNSIYSTCQPCLLGFYRNISESHLFCQQCPKGYTTFYMGSKDHHLCNVPIEGPEKIPINPINGCPQGYQPTNMNTECIICPLRSYKRGQGFTPCDHCPVNKTGDPSLTEYIGSSSQSLCLKEVEIVGILPTEGAVSGGFTLSVNLNPKDAVGRILGVTVAGKDCPLQFNSPYEGRINCTVGPSYQEGQMEVSVLLADGRMLVSPLSFIFHPDPAILEIGRSKLFASGGVNITVSGTNFKMPSAHMSITHIQPTGQHETVSSTCFIMNMTRFHCLVPDMTEWFASAGARRKREDNHVPLLGYLGFTLEKNTVYQNVTSVMPEYGALLIYLDPDIKPLTGKTSSIVISPNSSVTVTLLGSALNAGAVREDYNISVGQFLCTVTELLEDSIQCAISEADAYKIVLGLPYATLVNIGPFKFEPGYFTFSYPKTTTTTTNSPIAAPPVDPPLPGAGTGQSGGQSPSPTEAPPSGGSFGNGAIPPGESKGAGNSSPTVSPGSGDSDPNGTSGGSPSPAGNGVPSSGGRPPATDTSGGTGSNHTSGSSASPETGGKNVTPQLSGTPVPGSKNNQDNNPPSNDNNIPRTSPSDKGLNVKVQSSGQSNSDKSVSDGSGTDLIAILVPILVSLCVIAVIVIVVAILYCNRRRTRMYSDGSLMRHSQISGSGSDSSLGDAYLPPLPVDSVFGPERVTDRGVKQRQLSLPSDSGMSSIGRKQLPANVTYSYSTYSTSRLEVPS